MNEKEIKKIIAKSELKTSDGFTDTLMTAIEKEQPGTGNVVFWPLKKILLGFVVIAVVSGGLMYTLFERISDWGMALPVTWSLLLLLGLNYVMEQNKYQRVLQPE